MPDWKTFFDSLPPGLTLTEITRRLGEPYGTIRSAALRTHYAFTDGRRYGQQPNRRFVPEDADWSKSNIELSRQFGVSRERIRFLRAALGHPKVGKRGPQPKQKHDRHLRITTDGPKVLRSRNNNRQPSRKQKAQA